MAHRLASATFTFCRKTPSRVGSFDARVSARPGQADGLATARPALSALTLGASPAGRGKLRCGAALLAGVAAVLLAFGPARADVIVADPGGSDSYGLADILDAGGIRVGNLVFSQFRVVASSSEGGSAAGWDDIMVSGVLAEGEYGVGFNGSWTADDGGRADTTIGFQVTADEPWLLHDNSLWIAAFGASDGGLVVVTENVYDMDPRVNPSQAHCLAEKMVVYDGLDDGRIYDHVEYEIDGSPAAVSDVWVVKDIHVTSAGPGSTAAVSEVFQSFSQVPEPTTLVLVALGAVGVVLRRRRRAGR